MDEQQEQQQQQPNLEKENIEFRPVKRPRLATVYRCNNSESLKPTSTPTPSLKRGRTYEEAPECTPSSSFLCATSVLRKSKSFEAFQSIQNTSSIGAH